MTKKEFIEKYSISDTLPVDPSKKALPAESFATAITEFMENKFRGAIKVSQESISAQSILVCAEYVALFFKMLLTYVYGRVMLVMEISSDQSGLNINIHAEEDLPLTDSEMREIIRLARNGGFDIHPDDRCIKLFAGFEPTIARRIYAVTIVDGKRIMLGKMVEIFCRGELMNIDPKPTPKMPKPIEKRPSKRKTPTKK